MEEKNKSKKQKKKKKLKPKNNLLRSRINLHNDTIYYTIYTILKRIDLHDESFVDTAHSELNVS